MMMSEINFGLKNSVLTKSSSPACNYPS